MVTLRNSTPYHTLLFSSNCLRDLQSDNKWRQGIGRGKLLEKWVYYYIRENASSFTIKTIVRKWSDVPKRFRTQSKIGQNGLFYNRKGEIVARGNGMDLAEFDLLYVDKSGQVKFAEIKSSAKNLKNFNREISYKRDILNYIFNQSQTHCLIFSPKKVRCILSPVFSSDPLVSFIDTPDPEKNQDILLRMPQSIGNDLSNELIYLSELSQRPYDYIKIHDEARAEILMGNTTWVTSELFRLLSRILLGSICEPGLTWLLKEKEICINGIRLSPQNFSQYFTAIIFSLSLPNLRPVLYLRGREKAVYLKLGVNSISGFEFENNIKSKYTTLCKWLDCLVQSCLSKDQVTSILEKYLLKETAILNRKHGATPEINLKGYANA